MRRYTKELVMAKYTTANGYAANADVIYGDTDSVMIKFNCTDLKAGAYTRPLLSST